MPISYRNRAELMDSHPKIAEAFDDIVDHVQSVMQQTNASPNGQTDPPPPPSGINVQAADGIFDVQILDNHSEVNRGINYFLEYSKSPSFSSPTTIHLGPSRNFRANLGNQALHWRAHSAYPTSPRSNHVYHGSEALPKVVVGGGSSRGPDPLPSSGSGTSPGASGSDGAFGNLPKRTISRSTQ